MFNMYDLFLKNRCNINEMADNAFIKDTLMCLNLDGVAVAISVRQTFLPITHSLYTKSEVRQLLQAIQVEAL